MQIKKGECEILSTLVKEVENSVKKIEQPRLIIMIVKKQENIEYTIIVQEK